MDGVFQRGNKIKLDDVVVQNHQLELKGTILLLEVMCRSKNTGDSYNVKPLADNMDLYTGGSNSSWGARYKNALKRMPRRMAVR
jgi:hypothetical protein